MYVISFYTARRKDIDVVAVGQGIELAKAVSEKLGKKSRISFSKTLVQHR
jgi:hypothetical protein